MTHPLFFFGRTSRVCSLLLNVFGRIFKEGYFIFENLEPPVKGNVFYSKTWGLQMY